MTQLADVYPVRQIDMAAVAALGGAAPNLIAFRVQPQGERGQWCWAAVTSSVTGYPDPPHSDPMTMCEVASGRLHTNCCADPTPSPCDVQNTLDGPLAMVGRLRAPIITGHLSPNAVNVELNANLPVPIRVEWRGGGGHFLAIFGIRMLTKGVQYAVSDPIYGEARVMETSLVGGAYKAARGTWTHSYVLKL